MRISNWHKQRRNFMYWLIRDVCKMPEGQTLPWFLSMLKCIIFPLEAFDNWRQTSKQTSKQLSYDFYSDTLMINGIKVSRCFFHLLKENESFKVIKIENGVLTLERLNIISNEKNLS